MMRVRPSVTQHAVVHPLTSVVASLMIVPFLAGCTIQDGAAAMDARVADDVEVLIWAYGLIPSDADREQLQRLYQQDLRTAPQFQKDVDALRGMRDEMRGMDTSAYIGRWATLNSQLMRAAPSGLSTRYAHDAQSDAPGSHRYCASSSVVLTATTKAEFMCGGYRFAVIVQGPRGYPVLSYAPYDEPKNLQRIDWSGLTDEFRVIAEPSPGGPIAMRRSGMELFFSVAPPRR